MGLVEAVTLAGIAVFYLNLPGIATTVHGLPTVVAASAFLLLLFPFAVRVLVRGEPVVMDLPLVLILAFLGAVLLSLFSVQDDAAATAWVTSFLTEGLLMYFLALNLFRTPQDLRRAVSVLMLCGGLLAALTVYQEATRSYDRQFAGLAQRNIQEWASDGAAPGSPRRDPAKIRKSERAAGPIGDPNRYAQVLVVLLPLIFFRMRATRDLLLKAGVAVCLGLTLAAALLTYSRGAFLSLVALLACSAWMGAMRSRQLAIVVLLAAAAVFAFAPGYVLRIATLGGVSGLVESSQSVETEGALKGRLTEMLAALNVFLDHPVMGVGPGQYVAVHSKTYMNDPAIAFRRIGTERRAHDLYLELAADTGIVGLALFLSVAAVVLIRLWRSWQRWRWSRPDLAGLAAGFFLSLVGYLVTAIFLHLAYQRYYWLVLGLAGAALQVLRREEAVAEEPAAPAAVPAAAAR